MAILTKATKPPPHIVSRGDHMRHVLENGVIINTAYVAKTEEEKEKVNRTIAAAAWKIVDELIERGEEV